VIKKRYKSVRSILVDLFPFPSGQDKPVYKRLANAVTRRFDSLARRYVLKSDPDLMPTARTKTVKARARRIKESALCYFETSERRWLLDIIQESKSTGTELTDYYFIHRYVVSRRPKRILEFGSGRSSIVIAHALREAMQRSSDHEQGHLESMEDIPAYHEDVKKICPDELSSFVTFHLSPKKDYMWREMLWAFCYQDLPDGSFDLVFVDGQTAKRNGNVGVNGDVLVLAERNQEMRFDVIIDFRLVTCRALARLLPRPKFGFDKALGLGLIRDMNGQSIRTEPTLPRRLRDVDGFSFLNIS